MKFLAAALAALSSLRAAGATASCDGGLMLGPLNIEGYPDVWLAGENGTGNGDHLEIKHNAGMTPFTACEEEWAPGSMAQFKLLGRKLSFSVDLSSVGCACNLALYLISSPALDLDGTPSAGTNRAGQPPYYCDANKVGGQWCPEVDIMEANTHAFQATPHRCEKPSNGHYYSCDRSGCAQNTRDTAGAYGPGDNFTINTRRIFDVHTEFLEKGGVFTGMRTTIQQQDRQVVLDYDGCSDEYFAALSGALADGMSLRITYWGDAAETMAWMDSPPCGEQTCTGDNAGLAKISNVKVVPEIVAQSLTERKDTHSSASSAASSPASVPDSRAGLWPWVSLDPAETTTAQPATTLQATTTKRPTTTTPAVMVAKSSAKSKPQWVPDTYAPWACHQYVGNQQLTDWCQTVGFEGGFEYQYNGGTQSPCGACWCCKRKAKLVELPPTTTTRAPAHSTLVLASDDLIWVVSDPKDALFGQVVPKNIMEDKQKFVSLQDHGIVEMNEARHFVQRMDRSQYDARVGKDWAKWLSKKAPCPDDAEGPCEESIRDPSFLDMLVAKYSGDSSAPSGPGSSSASRWRLPIGPGLAVALLLPLVAIVFFAARLFRQHRRVSSGSGSRDPESLSPRSRTATTDSTCITAQSLGEGASPLRARSSSSSSATPLVVPRALAAGPRLHSMQEAAA